MAEMIDLNSDLGEGLADDDALLTVVTSANVACGFHAGDDATMERVTSSAAARGVVVGAQVSYRDREGFGRRFIEVDYATLRADVTEQLSALDRWCRAAGDRVRYVKPHGALYHACSTTPEHARAVLDAIAGFDNSLLLLAAAGSPFLASAERAGLTVVAEAFADRGYRDDGTLVSRDEPGALLSDPGAAAAQATAIAIEGVVRTATGATVPLDARSICVHSDTAGALDIAHAVRSALTAASVDIGPFA